MYFYNIISPHMKVALTILSSLFILPLLLGCAPSLSSQVDLSITTSETEVILGLQNEYKQKVNLNWKIINRSTTQITPNEYELVIMSGVPGDDSAIYIHELPITIEPESEQSGTYSYTIDGIVEEGNYEFRFELHKRDGEYFTVVKEAPPAPYSLHWEKQQ
jgi:hypothetical protein